MIQPTTILRSSQFPFKVVPGVRLSANRNLEIQQKLDQRIDDCLLHQGPLLQELINSCQGKEQGQEEGIKIQTVRSNDHYGKNICAKSCPKYQNVPLDS